MRPLFRIIKDEETEKEDLLCEMEPVVKAVAQVDDYLAQIDKNQRQVKEDEKIDVEKVRGKVIIGTLGSDSIQKEGLRRLNARLNRIEVITFDQLIARAKRMLDILGEQRDASDPSDETPPTPSPPSTVDEIPF